jgi:hypothetical protein
MHMNRTRTHATRLVIVAALMAGTLAAMALPAAAHATCSDVDFLAAEVHGQHVVRDYVIGGGAVAWPPSGSVGSAVGGKGAAVPGGPGPGFHFPNGVAPGASFCNDSKSPGVHV